MARPHSITANGNAQVDTAQSKFGGASALFDGSGDFLTSDDAINDFGVNKGEFTMECWFRPATTGQNAAIISFRRVSASITYDGGLVLRVNNNKIEFSNGSAWYTGTTTISANTWYHIAASRDSSGNFRLFVNGNLERTDSAGAWDFRNARPCTVGAITSDGNLAFNGHVDEVRFSTVARYTAAFTPSSSAFTDDEDTVILLHMDGTDGSTTFTDDNSSGFRTDDNIVVTAHEDAQVDTAQSKFGGASALFDGTGDYIRTSDIDALSFGTGDFTLEAWIRTTSTSNQMIISSRATNNAPDNNNNFGIVSGKLAWSDGSTWQYSSNSITTNAWMHVAVVRSSGTVTLYEDGTNVSSTTNTESIDNLRAIFIGAFNTNSTFFNGHIDEVRVSDTARYTANFTPHTTPHINDDNTLLLMHMDGTDGSTTFTVDNGVDRSARDFRSINGAQISTTESKFGGSSLFLDGVNDFIVNGTSTEYIPHTQSDDFTIEGWVNFNDVAQTWHMFAGNYYPTNNDSFYVGVKNNGSSIYSLNVAVSDGSSVYYQNMQLPSAPSTGVWYHWAVSKSGSSLKHFWNGTELTTTYATSGTYSSSKGSDGLFYIGRYKGGLYTDGYLDEIRFSSTARYTANFTPQTAPHINDDNTLLLMHMDGTDGDTDFIDDNSEYPEGVTHEGAASLSSSFTQTADGGRIQEGSADLSGAMTATITAVASLNGSIDVASSVSFSVTADRLVGVDVTLNNIINLSLQGTKIHPGSSAFSSEFAQTTTADRTRGIESSLAVSFDQSATGTRIQPGNANLGGAFNATMTAVASLNGSIDVLSSATVTVDAGLIQPGSADFTSAYTLASNSGYLLEDTASMSSAFTQTASAIQFAAQTFPQSWRPLEWQNVGGFTSDPKVYGTSSARIFANTTERLTETIITDTNSFTIDDNEDFVIEFWLRFTNDFDNRVIANNPNKQYTFFQLSELSALEDNLGTFTGNQNLSGIFIGGDGSTTSNKPMLVVATPDTNTNKTIILNTNLSTDTWYHWRVRRVNNTIYFNVGGASGSTSYSGDFDFYNTSSDFNLWLANIGDTTGQYLNIDALAMRVGDSTITGTSSPPRNDELYQIFNFPFDDPNENDDYLGDFDWYGSASLNTAFTQIANGGIGAIASADLDSSATITAELSRLVESEEIDISSAATLTADVGILQTADSALNAIFSQTSTVGAIRRAVTSLQAVFAQNATTTRLVGVDTAITANSSLSATATRIQPGSADFDAVVSQLSAVTRIAGLLLEPDSQFTMVADADLLADTGANLDSTATVTIDGALVAGGEIAVDSAFTQTTTTANSLTVGVDSSVNIIASVSVDATRIQDASADLSVETTIRTDVSGGLIGFNATELTSAFTAEIEGTRVRFGPAGLFAQTAMVVTPQKILSTTAELDSAGGFSISISANKVGETQLDSEFGITATADIIASPGADLESSATITVSATHIKGLDAQLDTATALAALGGLTAEISADLSAQITVFALISTPHLDQYVYTVPRENRTFSIGAESRSFTVNQESRAYTVPQEGA